ncbi:MAG: class I SAM-dependent methyltransferase [Sulfurospirillaceae bacterium]|nr:class I SAM-dependent methyltransferase [Sulfurospirillaceae bacterium]
MNKWDEKAKNYARYTENEDGFEANVLKVLNVDFSKKTVLDIGCGTGVYTIRIAKKALRVDAIDSSKGMLDVLEQDAKRLNISNITIKHTSWSDFHIKNTKYDFAISTMSPAVSEEDDFIKMDKCAKVKIYLGWAGVRDNEILESLFAEHGSVYKSPNGAKRIEDWLKKNNKQYRQELFREERVTNRNLQEAIENFSWHLEIRGLIPQKELIKKILQKYSLPNGYIQDKTISHMKLLVWE